MGKCFVQRGIERFQWLLWKYQNPGLAPAIEWGTCLAVHMKMKSLASSTQGNTRERKSIAGEQKNPRDRAVEVACTDKF